MELKLKYEGPWGDVGDVFCFPTGSFRYHRPVMKSSKCSQCGWCYIYCPTGSIVNEARRFAIDLTYCKGCGVCASICSVNAIMMVRET